MFVHFYNFYLLLRTYIMCFTKMMYNILYKIYGILFKGRNVSYYQFKIFVFIIVIMYQFNTYLNVSF